MRCASGGEKHFNLTHGSNTYAYKGLTRAISFYRQDNPGRRSYYYSHLTDGMGNRLKEAPCHPTDDVRWRHRPLDPRGDALGHRPSPPVYGACQGTKVAC